MNTKHAVLTPNQLFINEDRRICRIELRHSRTSVRDCYDLARDHAITHCWIMPGTEIGMEPEEGYDLFATYEDDEKTRPMFARIYKKGVFGEVKIGWPACGSWGWEIDSPTTALATIYYLEQVLGVAVEWSPGHMGTELVKHLNRTEKRGEWVRDATINLFELPIKRSARDLIWKTELEIESAVYLHQFDKRSAYLAACGDLYVGAGDPTHISGSCDPALPGVYCVAVHEHPRPFDGKQLPEIITTEWVTADVLNYARKFGNGFQIFVIEGWQWTEKHKTLASYADKLWNSRRVFREDAERFPHPQGRQNAENTMKEIALVSTGKFASEKSGAFRQPYWWAAVVGKARVLMLANIYKIFAQTGLTPALIYSDSVYYASTESDPRKAVPGILDREDKLGGFRHDGTWKITAEIVEIFKTEKPGAIQKWLEHTEKEVLL